MTARLVQHEQADVSDYSLVECTFCGVSAFQDCVKVRGKDKGKPASQFHAQRAYLYWRVRHTPLKAET